MAIPNHTRCTFFFFKKPLCIKMCVNNDLKYDHMVIRVLVRHCTPILLILFKCLKLNSITDNQWNITFLNVISGHFH